MSTRRPVITLERATAPAQGGMVAALTSRQQAVTTLNTAALAGHPDNSRARLDLAAGFVSSIRTHGVLEPLVVVTKDALTVADPAATKRLTHPAATHIVVAGHRRLAAAIECALPQVPVVVNDALADPTTARTVFLIENLHRTALNPVDEAKTLAELIDQTGLSQRKLAAEIGISQSHLSKRLMLLALPQEALAALTAGTLPVGTAVTLAGLGNAAAKQLWTAANGNLKTLRAHIRDHTSAGSPAPTQPQQPNPNDCTSEPINGVPAKRLAQLTNLVTNTPAKARATLLADLVLLGIPTHSEDIAITWALLDKDGDITWDTYRNWRGKLKTATNRERAALAVALSCLISAERNGNLTDITATHFHTLTSDSTGITRPERTTPS